MPLKTNDASLMFNGKTQQMKFYFVTDQGLEFRHTWAAHDVGVNDGSKYASQDAYGHDCKMPPGSYYPLGSPLLCGPQSDDGAAYGWWAIPINDNADGILAKHGRSGLMIHGGGSGLADPFAPQQGWEDTFGCIRMQNQDIALETPAPDTLVFSLSYVAKLGGRAYLTVWWG